MDTTVTLLNNLTVLASSPEALYLKLTLCSNNHPLHVKIAFSRSSCLRIFCPFAAKSLSHSTKRSRGHFRSKWTRPELEDSNHQKIKRIDSWSFVSNLPDRKQSETSYIILHHLTSLFWCYFLPFKSHTHPSSSVTCPARSASLWCDPIGPNAPAATRCCWRLRAP